MKLYYSKGACSLAVRITLHEIGITCEYESVNLKTKQTETDQNYLDINPKGAVPALRLDDNQILTENVAIQQYLADHFHAKTLLPELSSLKRYRVIEWLGFINSDVHKSYGAFFNPEFTDELREKIFKPLLMKKLSFLEKHLQNNTYLLGDEFTIADSYLFVVLRWMPVTKIDPQLLPNIMRYMQTVKERKSVQNALKEEGLI